MQASHPSSSDLSRSDSTLKIARIFDVASQYAIWTFFLRVQRLHNQVVDVKIIRQRPSGQHAGYGFVEFANQYEAQHVLNSVNGMPIPNSPQGNVLRNIPPQIQEKCSCVRSSVLLAGTGRSGFIQSRKWLLAQPHAASCVAFNQSKLCPVDLCLLHDFVLDVRPCIHVQHALLLKFSHVVPVPLYVLYGSYHDLEWFLRGHDVNACLLYYLITHCEAFRHG
jgi:hypothetical protein